jgi:hypothetical protein
VVLFLRKVLEPLVLINNNKNDELFNVFIVLQKQGKIVKSKYPNHYVIFNDLYLDKCIMLPELPKPEED